MSELRLMRRIAFRISLALVLLGLPKAVLANVEAVDGTALADQVFDFANNLLSVAETSGCSFDSLGLSLGGLQNQYSAGQDGAPIMNMHSEQFSGWDGEDHDGGHAEQHSQGQ